MASKIKSLNAGVKLVFLAAVVLLLTLSVVSFVKTKKLIDLADTINHTTLIKVEIEKTLSFLKDAETGQRGYLLTQDTSFLEPFNTALSNTHNSLRTLDSLFSDNPKQMIRMRELHRLAETRIDYLGRLILQAKEGITYSTAQLIQGKVLMDKARLYVQEMMESEEADLRQKKSSLNEQAAITPLLAVILTLFALLVMLAAYFKIIGELSKSRELQATLLQKEANLKHALEELEKNKAQQVTIETARRFELIANTMTQFIWTTDPSGKFNYLSKTFFEGTGTNPDEISQNGWIAFVHPDDREASVKEWMNAVKSGKPFTFEHRFKTKDGPYRWQLSRAVPLVNDSNELVLWVGTSTDIQEQKDFSQSLEKQVKLRTGELIKANDTLEKANEELAQFAYIASHDLQEPLRKIQTFISMLEGSDEPLSEKGRQYFSRIQNAAKRMQQLIVDILSYSRATKDENAFEEKDIDAILAAVKEEMSETIKQSGAEIFSENLPVLHVIAYQFEQLLGNILSNAIKFTSPGVKPVIKITGGTKTKDEINLPAAVRPLYHFIEIRDNGIGFDMQYKDRIFNLFQRLNSRETYGGTGIGLAIVKKIAENHSGFITADSVPNKGSVFTIYIPVATIS